ncbi:MAG TPA: EthD domain-containing protein [Steroidobacteraceae bacterium]|jgi:uncharacterized protein (TIGR02118 family)
MKKVIVLLNRKAGMTREEFRSYYEGHHVPLATSLMKNCKKYVRNYARDDEDRDVRFPLSSHDCVSEFVFDIDEPWRGGDQVFEASGLAALGEDEKRFIDVDSVQVLIVDEYQTNF